MRRAKGPLGHQSVARPAAARRPNGSTSPRALRRRRAAAGFPRTRRAIIVLPEPGGPTISRLCPPAAAISSARRASACPWTSAKIAVEPASAGAAAQPAAGARPERRRVVQRARPLRRAIAPGRARALRRPPPRLRWLRQQQPATVVAPGGRGDRQHAARRHGCRRRATARRAAATSCDVAARRRSPVAARMPSAIGRSNDEPALRTSAGARLTVTRCCGNSNPELRIALRTRSRLSRTLASGRPTIVKCGSPNDTSTSTWTGTPRCRTPRRSGHTRASTDLVQARGHRGSLGNSNEVNRTPQI